MRGNWFAKAVDRYAGIPLVWVLGMVRTALPSRRVADAAVQHVLVIKLAALGDSILLIPALRKLKQAYPAARVTVLCSRINEVVFRNAPYVDAVIVVDMASLLRNPMRVRSVFPRSKRYDIAFDFEQWVCLSPLLALLSRAPLLLGFKTPGRHRHFLFDRTVEHMRDRHEIDCFLDLVHAASPTTVIIPDDRALSFPLPPEARDEAEKLCSKIGLTGPFIIFHPETPAHGRQRQWPPENYAALGRMIVTERPDISVLITGTAQDTDSNREIAQMIGASARVLPPIPFMAYAAVLARARAMVCGNTGVMHLACALNVPVVALHGPTDPRKWGPVSPSSVCLRSSLPCSPCLYLGFEYACPSNRCMRTITPEAVVTALRGIAVL